MIVEHNEARRRYLLVQRCLVLGAGSTSPYAMCVDDEPTGEMGTNMMRSDARLTVACMLSADKQLSQEAL